MKVHALTAGLLATTLSLALVSAPRLDADPAAAPALTSAGPVELAVDGGHSSCVFRIQHMGAAYFYGRFNRLEGSIVYDADEASKCSVELTIDAGSVDTNSDKRDQHVLSPDFLDAKQFPRMAFKSSKVEAKGGLLVATGTLELHGAKKEVTIEIEKTGVAEGRGGGRVYGFHTSFTIDRTDFGMTNMVGPLGKEVVVMVGLEAKGA
jgi:polyisoprenoid-binding protein YceI